jgi:tRNA(fMet)-specific endonuclease VapC
MYVLDTNTLIYFFKGIGNVSNHLFDVPPKDIGIPSIVLFELEVGIAKSSSPQERQTQLKNFASIVSLLPFGFSEAGISASIRANLEQQGNSIGPYDVLIAGTAIANKGILVTHNTSEFSRIQGLRLVDWY